MAAFPDHQLHHFTRIFSSPISLHFQYLFYVGVILSIFLPIYRFVHRDYHDFLSLGPGGTPSTFAGYLRVSYLRLFTLKDPFTPPAASPTTLPASGYLLCLPRRPETRPRVAGIAPHRQTNQIPSPQVHGALRAALHSFAGVYPTLLRKGNSCFEKHGLALFMTSCLETKAAHMIPPLLPHGKTSQLGPATSPIHLNPTCADTAEICHLHASVSCVLSALISYSQLFPDIVSPRKFQWLPVFSTSSLVQVVTIYRPISQSARSDNSTVLSVLTRCLINATSYFQFHVYTGNFSQFTNQIS